MLIDIREDSPEYTPKLVTVRVEYEWEHQEMIKGLADLVKQPVNGTTREFLEAILRCLDGKL